MSYTFISVLSFCVVFGFVNGQCPERKFTRHYLEPSTTVVLDEVYTRTFRECSVFCARRTDCLGFTGGNNDTCVMYYDVNREISGSMPIWMEGEFPVSCKWHWDQANKTGNTLPDGIYQIWYECHWISVYCDMTANGGGWTLLLSNTDPGRDWTLSNIRERNSDIPGLGVEYSILQIGDNIRKRSRASTFEYRIEMSGRGRWGGIWRAPGHYSLIDETGSQTFVTELMQFDSYLYDDHNSLGLRVPWIHKDHVSALFTTTNKALPDSYWYGTLVMKESAPAVKWSLHGPAPLMEGSYNLVDGTKKTMISPIYYWFRMG